MGLHYIGGILKHAKSIAALTNPTTNSYRRLVPGFEAPVNLAYSSRNRSASIRIPITGPNPKTRRIEVRFPDPSCNPYLAFAAMLMAGLDGVQNKINPGDPLDKDIYALSPEELKDVPQMPGSLEESLNNLERDHEFLLKGDVFTKDAIHEWLDFKRTKELNPIRMRPTPHEFFLYYDIVCQGRRGSDLRSPRGAPPTGFGVTRAGPAKARVACAARVFRFVRHAVAWRVV